MRQSRLRYAPYAGRGATALVVKAQSTLSLTREGLADFLGSSRRTMTRWRAGQSRPSVDHLQVLARAVHAAEPGLAARLTEEGGVEIDEARARLNEKARRLRRAERQSNRRKPALSKPCGSWRRFISVSQGHAAP